LFVNWFSAFRSVAYATASLAFRLSNGGLPVQHRVRDLGRPVGLEHLHGAGLGVVAQPRDLLAIGHLDEVEVAALQSVHPL
jgi:hypothetical protein